MKLKYHSLLITAAQPNRDIWLADEEGNLVQKSVGVLQTRLLPGRYSIRFGRSGPDHPFGLTQDTEYHQEDDE